MSRTDTCTQHGAQMRGPGRARTDDSRGVKRGRHRTPGRFRTRVITDGLTPSLHVDYKHTTIKQYHNQGRALRIETTIKEKARCKGVSRWCTVSLGAVPAAEPSGAQSTTHSSDPIISVRELLHGRAEHPRQPGGQRDDPLGQQRLAPGPEQRRGDGAVAPRRGEPAPFVGA